jgi:drug/metabolite transporter (DMT)-like permease
MTEKKGWLNWGIFMALSIIWGSSFMLMKVGLKSLSAYQVAAIRMLSAGLILLPVAIRSFTAVPRHRLGYIILSGFLGSFFPSFLFCIAETRIDSSLAGILNSLTALFTMIIGVLFFRAPLVGQKLLGVIVGFIGLVLLFALRGKWAGGNLAYASLVILATILYGLNVNMVGASLRAISSVQIAAIAFAFLIPPSFAVLLYTGYFSLPLTNSLVALSSLASITLGILGTALASILFYILLKRAGAVFASMVTYGIPFVAIIWGMAAGEWLSWPQVASLSIILLGVYLVNRQVRTESSKVV